MIPLFIKSLSKPETRTPTVEVTPPAKVEESTAGTSDTSKFAGLLAVLAEHNPKCDFGPHNVEKGHTVAFKAGSFVGSGKVESVGKHGVTVSDDDARDHRVHWHEVTGHVGKEKDKPAKKEKGAKADDAA